MDKNKNGTYEDRRQHPLEKSETYRRWIQLHDILPWKSGTWKKKEKKKVELAGDTRLARQVAVNMYITV